ncbi:hypothetical protein SSPS47_27085 [Streptomyces sp. S4.7]|uniref:hypothetical protein n=1 Tax=Streptomyces sp. S4.7 TaxID=2705439 RepID=UPI001396FBD8|nr:hypothetical protein [Streptomyces sp. S4.7]QHY98775.1 hypothetical protein SSPS47_27085 [Streptomyces sp. S4.7]
MRWRSGRLPTTCAWLLVAAVAVGAGALPEPFWLKIVFLIGTAAALRLALTGIWPKMRSTQSSAPVPGGRRYASGCTARSTPSTPSATPAT